MKILAIDTATENCSAALLVDGHVVAREMETERGAADHILSMVDGLLREGGVTLGALDALAFGRGPGGFTGVRLAASVVQGLAFGADLPVVGVSDLAAVAQRALDLAPDVARVVVCNDARMKEVYWGCFERDADGMAVAVGAEHVCGPGAVSIPDSWIKEALDRRAARTKIRETAGRTTGGEVPAAFGEAAAGEAARIGVVGRGFRAYPELRERLVDAEGLQLISDELLPRAQEIARLAVIEVQSGRTLRAEEATPVYLRDDVAKPQPSRN